MKNCEIKGIIPPILTPMNNDAEQTVNHAELRNQVERLIAGGVHGLFPFGTNGEGYILSLKEKEAILETVIDQVKGRVPVYAGTGCISTADTIYMSRRAEELGADVLSIITPSFALASQKELYDHYVEVAPFLQENTIETTGAGDTFCACVLNYVLEHDLEALTDEQLKEMLTFANAAASIITTRKGALRVMPTREEVLDFLKKQEA